MDRQSTSLALLVLLTALRLVAAGPASSTRTSGFDTLWRPQQQQRQERTQFDKHDAVALSRSKFSRWKQRVRHRRLTQRVPASRAKVEAHGRRGTCLRLFGARGTLSATAAAATVDEDRIARLFASDRSSAHHPAPFNHNMVGMTNPCLHVGDDVVAVANTNMDRDRALVTMPASRSSSSSSSEPPRAATAVDNNDEESSWWPGTACFHPQADDNLPQRFGGGWKVLRLRRRVGCSPGCYQAVRDAALRWEFDGEGTGIVCVSSASKRRKARASTPSDEVNLYSIAPGYYRVEADAASSSNGSRSTDPRTRLAYEECDMFRSTQSDQVLQIWSGPGSRRLVTYSSKPSGRWFRLLVMSPVGVVYDLVDQRGSDGTTTYTSTAYATLRGHWLAGEERVTVALRDGGSVDVEILSYSRPSRSLPGRLAWPFVGGLQRRFFEQQLRALERVAAQSTATAPTAPSGLPPES